MMEHKRKDFLLLFMFIMMILQKGEAQLSENFYRIRCPNVESIVRQAVAKKFKETSVTAQATLRLFFHDCGVEGCDASVMILSTNGDAEKDAEDNISLPGDGFDTVVKAKQAVEAKCPGVVSCADILALATRDVIALVGGPSYQVELGRRDGLVSLATRVPGNLPAPEMNLTQLTALFSKHNLTLTDLVALSGAHTIGVSHCNRFMNRLYNFSSSSQTDPSLDPTYTTQLMASCPRNVDSRIAVPMDPTSPVTFDNAYFQALVAGKGMFTSDQVLFTNPTSQTIVIDFANNPDKFISAFITAMRKLGRVGVKTGNNGEIRRDCSTFNS